MIGEPGVAAVHHVCLDWAFRRGYPEGGVEAGHADVTTGRRGRGASCPAFQSGLFERCSVVLHETIDIHVRRNASVRRIAFQHHPRER